MFEICQHRVPWFNASGIEMKITPSLSSQLRMYARTEICIGATCVPILAGKEEPLFTATPYDPILRN